MMTNDDRRKVFWLLKKYSSYTAWHALGDAYYAFADAYMQAIRLVDHSQADKDDEDALADEAKEILDGRLGFEHGLPRLRQGDRSVWRRNSRGALLVALRSINFIDKILDESEFVLDWMKNKDEVLDKHRALDFWCGGTGSVTERKAEDQVAPLNASNALVIIHPDYGWKLNDPAYHNFPPTLPEVPHPSTTVIDTGAEVPFDGIYEPEWGPMQDPSNSGLIDKLKAAFGGKPSLTNTGDPQAGLATTRRAETGCMNYLLAHTQAPLYQDGELDKPMPVTWRLIWKDERYLDGVVPPEEAEFLAPASETPVERLRCEAGQPCPREGWWFTPAKLDSRRHSKQGEAMPDLKSDWGSVIWQWDTRQDG